MMPMRQWIVTASAGLLLGACGQSAPPPLAVAPAPTFSVARVAEVATYPERSAPAAVIGKNEARISAEVAARILAMPVDVGERVKRGALVAQLAPRDAELALERAEAARAQSAARHEQALAQAGRARSLRAQNFYSAEALTLRETELAAAAADLRAAVAQRDTARHALEKHSLRAPFDAIVRARSGQVGELAAPGTVLLTLVDSRTLQAAAQLQPQDAASLQAAASAEFEAAGQRYALQLLRISPALNRESRSSEARLDFIAAPPAAGLAGRLLWRETQAYLPAELLVRRNGRYGVFVAAEGRAHFHALAAAQEGRPALIDLPLETSIVTQGRHALQDGMAIQQP